MFDNSTLENMQNQGVKEMHYHQHYHDDRNGAFIQKLESKSTSFGKETPEISIGAENRNQTVTTLFDIRRKYRGGTHLEESNSSANVEESAKEKPKKKRTNTTRLEKILCMQEKISEYCDEGEDDAAFGLLRKQLELGASVGYIPILIDYHETLLKTYRGEKSLRIFDQLVSLMKNKLEVTVKECERLGTRYRENEEYFKSILIYQIGGVLLEEVSDADRFLSAVQGYALGIKLCVMQLVEKQPSYNEVLKVYVFPKMLKMVDCIPNLRGKSKKALCVIECACRHHVEICEGLVGDFLASEKTLFDAVLLMENTLGVEEAKKLHVYGTVLNNLGATYLRQQRPHEAITMLARSIDANMNATDYSSNEERERDVKRSESAMTQAEELIKSMRE